MLIEAAGWIKFYFGGNLRLGLWVVQSVLFLIVGISICI